MAMTGEKKFRPAGAGGVGHHLHRYYRRAYRDNQPNSLADVEKLVKAYKSHRAADVFDKAFCLAE